MKKEEAERAQKTGSEVRIRKNGFVFRGTLAIRYGSTDYYVFEGRNGNRERIRCMERASEFSLRGR